MKRLATSLVLLGLVAAPTAEAHKLYLGEAKRAIKQVAKNYYRGEYLLAVRNCRRWSEHRVRCTVIPFWTNDYCLTKWEAVLRFDTIRAGPRFEYC